MHGELLVIHQPGTLILTTMDGWIEKLLDRQVLPMLLIGSSLSQSSTSETSSFNLLVAEGVRLDQIEQLLEEALEAVRGGRTDVL
jgi:hypothetical protein